MWQSVDSRYNCSVLIILYCISTAWWIKRLLTLTIFSFTFTSNITAVNCTKLTVILVNIVFLQFHTTFPLLYKSADTVFTVSRTLIWAVFTGPTDWVCHIGTLVPCVEAVDCLELYYCNMVEWFWWDSSLISFPKWPIMCRVVHWATNQPIDHNSFGFHHSLCAQ